MWGTYFVLKRKNANFDNEDLNESLGENFLEKLKDLKPSIILDINLDTFERKMHLVNDLLSKKKLFLRLYEKNKFKYVFKKGHDKNEVQKEVSACIDLIALKLLET